MKQLALIFLFLPLAAYTQENIAKKNPVKIEIGLNHGYCPDNAQQPVGDLESGHLRLSLRGLIDMKHIQTGLTIEGGTLTNDYWYLSPAVIFNYKTGNGKSFFYIGCMLGYMYSKDMIPNLIPSNKADGYVSGIQIGHVSRLSKHWAFTSEIAMRSAVVRASGDYYQSYYVQSERESILLLPISIGMSYRL